MKHRPILHTTTLLLGATLLFTSCEALKGIPNTSANKGTAATEKTQSQQKPSKPKKRDVLPQDREQFIIDKNAVTYTADDIKKGVLAGDWAIEQVAGKDVQPGDPYPYVKFDKTGGRFYACNGCNYLSGTFKYDMAAHTIALDNVATTMRECPDAEYADDINAALSEANFYTLEQDGSKFYITLLDENRSPLMRLMHQDFAFLDGVWTVKALNDEPINAPSDLRFVIDTAEHKVHGNTGCNLVNGRIMTDMDAPNSISFQQFTIGSDQCTDIDYESELIVAFEDAATAKPISADKVLLINDLGVVVLELERVK